MLQNWKNDRHQGLAWCQVFRCQKKIRAVRLSDICCFAVIKRPCFERQIRKTRRYTNVVGCSVKILHSELFAGSSVVLVLGFVQVGTPNGHGVVFSPSCCNFHCFCRLRGLFLSSAVPELWFCSSGGVCVRMRVCSEPLYL